MAAASLPPVIDLHTHILPGLDDGARTVETSIAMAVAAVARGVTKVAVTPHVRDDYPTSAEAMLAALAELRRTLERAAIQLELLPGAEIAFDRIGRLHEKELAAFGLGGNPRYLLIECPYHGWPLGFEAEVFRLRRKKIVPVIAHPERNAEVQENPSTLAGLLELGALMQITAASITGGFGRAARSTAIRLIASGNAHLVASDDHGGARRKVDMAALERALRDRELVHWLTNDVPASIATNSPIPPRPETRRRASLLRPRGTAGPA
jgi:protein-tyrosine phosphatase